MVVDVAHFTGIVWKGQCALSQVCKASLQVKEILSIPKSKG